LLNDRTIYYQYIDQIKDRSESESISKQVVISADVISAEEESQVHKFFPFTKTDSSPHFFVPNWIKSLLYQFYTIKDTKKVIKYFNNGGNIDLD
jgi:hypothetical protein